MEQENAYPRQCELQEIAKATVAAYGKLGGVTGGIIAIRDSTPSIRTPQSIRPSTATTLGKTYEFPRQQPLSQQLRGNALRPSRTSMKPRCWTTRHRE
ncbi:uncharacterized protein Z518_07465 [Rhinocladiella mackenziei CBS 650.93]|uniref:Uncharacterized protein n=1 Tax=Rhinocladiella mackenziei CBS 650.93 TaxID=1442369 RepID=A0A0D2FP58_9EURO|nr:uncharacterized protein Z518_07465 [Rhinocladiella mackenziei CBS 650.93]KIX03912.1 hypothetical protein Z518_07465 [Rhinocladiella mackenziei CBS 650.93]